MVRRFAGGVIVLGLLLVSPMLPASVATTCTAAAIASGNCSVGGGTTDDGVDLWGDVTTGGSGGTSSGDGPDECPIVVNDRCVGSSPPKDGNGPTTVSDLESFRPRIPVQYGEPAGWSVRSVPTNFWSTTAVHVVSGELLGNPAEVRFTPVLFRRYFGDGQRLTTTTAGRPWRELNQSPWTRTPTSHAYSSTGQFVVRLRVWYSAEFRFGEQNWTALVGEVTSWANDLTMSVFAADTVLVDRACGPESALCGPTSF